MIKIDEHVNPETKIKTKEFVNPHDVIRKKILDSAMKGNVDACHYLLQNKFDGELTEALGEYLKNEENGENLTKNLKRAILEEYFEDEEAEVKEESRGEHYTFSPKEVKAAREAIVRAAISGDVEACQYILEQSKDNPELEEELNDGIRRHIDFSTVPIHRVRVRRDDTGRIFIGESWFYHD